MWEVLVVVFGGFGYVCLVVFVVLLVGFVKVGGGGYYVVF